MRRKLIMTLFSLLSGILLTFAQDEFELGRGGAIDVISDGRRYHSALSAPNRGAPHPGIIVLPSSQGTQSWEYGFNTLTDEIARRGYVVLGLGWQTFEQYPDETVMKELIEDGIAVLREQPDVAPDRIGLVGFGQGGDYIMRLLPQLADVDVTVTFYGIPPDDTTSTMMGSTTTPLLIIHGANDEVSPIANIFEYAVLLDAANVPFELKVYADEGQGFMLRDGLLREDALAQDAFTEMLSFLQRHLR